MKNFLIKIAEEIIGNGIGWVSGLWTTDIVSYFFVKKRLLNAWGLLAFKREAVSKDTFYMLEWITAAIIGFIILMLVNRFIGKPLSKRFSEKKGDN